MVGKTLGHYEILEPLGAGGMGEVYRARDTKLDRDVAIKVLPEDFATDPERLARLEREAKLLASLNHANIAAIYGLEDEGDQRFIVMEVVEGETLAERISRSGRIEVDEALEIARQIAEALEAAHESGVVHRDLKPANVIVTGDGKAKVLDFGLAKAYAVDGSAADASPPLSQSPTVVAATQAGVILGTAAYMSPEQAKGKPLDKRTDIWAFGALLYEMFTGRSAFGAEDVSETLAAILKDQPDWGALPPTVPPTAKALLRRCLRKNPNRRVHDIADARIEIDESLEESAGDPAMAGVLPEPRRPGLRVIPWVIAAVAVTTAIATVAIYTPEPSVSAPTLHVAALHPLVEPRLRANQSPPFAVSPDGATLLYWEAGPDASQLHVKRLDEIYGSPLAEPESVGVQSSLVFSPGGDQIVFEQGAKLWRMPTSGGPRVEICDLPGGVGSGLRGSSWGADDNIVLGLMREGLARVSARGGAVEPLTESRDGQSHQWPQVLPGGDAVVFAIGSGNWDEAAIAVLDLETRVVDVLPDIEGTYPRYVSTGHLLFARAGALFAVPFDLERREVTGSAMPVIDDVIVDTTGNGSAHYAVSDNGLLVYATPTTVQREFVFVNREGVEPVGFDAGKYVALDVSPDGRLLATLEETLEGRELYVLDFETMSTRRLATGPLSSPVWWPDSKRLSFASAEFGNPRVLSVLADGSSTPIPTTDGLRRQFPGSVSQDGVLIYQQQNTGGSSWDLYAVALDGETEPELLVQSAGSDGGATFAPNGRFFAYSSSVSGRYEVYVLPYPDHASWGLGPQISFNGGSRPRWGPRGRQLFFIDGDRLMVAAVTTEPEFVAELPVEVFRLGEDLEPGGATFPAAYGIMPDGERFVFRRQVSVTPPSLLLVVNWFEELKRLAPTDGSR